jgi:hypothetical protein
MDDNKVAVLFEDLIAKFRTFGEGLDGLRGELKEFKQDMTDFKNDTTTRLDRIEYQNKQEHQQIIQAVRDLDVEVKRSLSNSSKTIGSIFNNKHIQPKKISTL